MLNSFLIWKMQMKTLIRCTPNRLAKLKKTGVSIYILKMRKLRLREAKTLVQWTRMPRAVCSQCLLSFCSEGVVRLTSTDQRLLDCISHFANCQWAPPLTRPMLGTESQGLLTPNLCF